MAGGGIGNLLDISRRALFTQTQSIRVIGSNIANVNTPGYSRRKAEIVTQEPLSTGVEGAVGSGAKLNQIVRELDQFLNRDYLSRIMDRAKHDVRDEILQRAEALFTIDNKPGEIGYELTEFFSSLQDLALNPSDSNLRSTVIQRGNSLTLTISSFYNEIASLQREADTRIGDFIGQINGLASQIAELNGQIGSTESSEQPNLTLRDRRDQLLRDLSEIITFNEVENSDGSIMVSLESGFGLVTGSTARALAFTPTPSFQPAGGFPTALDGGALGHIVYDYDSTSTVSHINLTSILAAGGGEVAGLLSLRGVQSTTDTSSFDAVGDLVDLAAPIEALSRDLLVRFNTAYLGDQDENPVTPAWDASSGDLNGNSPTAFGLFTFDGAADSDADGLPETSDLVSIGYPSYARLISFGITDNTALAAALDLDANPGSTSFAAGDASNIERLIALRDETVDYSTYQVGSFSASTTIEQLYQQTVLDIGSLKQLASNNLAIAEDREAQTQELQQSVSGVSIDEEFAQLINFQRAFEAAARVVKIGDDLLSEIIGMLG